MPVKKSSPTKELTLDEIIKAKRASSPTKKAAAPVEEGSVTESEYFSCKDQSESVMHVDMPITQALPLRRNDGSLSLYSEEKKSGKHSGASADENDSAEAELEAWVRERQQRTSPRRKSPVNQTRKLSSSDEDSEMAYNGQMNFTQPIERHSEYSDSKSKGSNSEYNVSEVMGGSQRLPSRG